MAPRPSVIAAAVATAAGEPAAAAPVAVAGLICPVAGAAAAAGDQKPLSQGEAPADAHVRGTPTPAPEPCAIGSLDEPTAGRAAVEAARAPDDPLVAAAAAVAADVDLIDRAGGHCQSDLGRPATAANLRASRRRARASPLGAGDREKRLRDADRHRPGLGPPGVVEGHRPSLLGRLGRRWEAPGSCRSRRLGRAPGPSRPAGDGRRRLGGQTTRCA